MRSGSEAFFQIAVALIPAFLFGGAMRKPEKGLPSGPGIRTLFVGVLVVSVVAEILAIRGVIDPAVNRVEQFWVVFTIVGGTVLIAALTAWSWLGDRATTAGTPSKVALVGCLLVAFAFAAWGITQSLDNVDARNEVVRADGQVRTTTAALARADQAVSGARTLLITTLVEMRSRSRVRLARLVQEQIHAIDVLVQPLLKDDRPRRAIIDSVEQALFEPIGRLRRPFYEGLGTRRADPERHLAALAVDRLVLAERVRLAAKDRSAQARRHHARACSEFTEGESGEAAAFGCPTGGVP
jgi:hypothetical protein